MRYDGKTGRVEGRGEKDGKRKKEDGGAEITRPGIVYRWIMEVLGKR